MGERGSALLTAIIFTFVVVTLLGSYLFLSTSEYRVSTRSYLLGASFNLAEGGLDRALHALYQNDNTGWRSATDGVGRPYWAQRFGAYDLGGNIKGYINVVILNPTGSAPEIFSEGEAVGHVAGTLKKQLYAGLNSGFYPFLNGFNSKRGIVLKGNNVLLDSYDSRNGNYGLGNINSEITVSTISVESDAVDVGNADIYGYVATGGGQPDVGPHGSITTYANPGEIDNSRITTDFYAQFPNVTAPTLSSPQTSMPSAGTVAGGEYLLSSWSSNSSSPLYITGHTVVVLSGDMTLSGNGLIIIEPDASLTIYANDDIDLGGNGVLNKSQKPEQFMIFGTDPGEGDDEIRISGNGYLSAAVYAPNAYVSLNGGGTSGRVFGAVVAYDAKLVGNSHFSYDEALESYNLGGAGYQVDKWVELSGIRLTAMRMNMSDYGF
jgi:hypothetical protein